MKKYIVLIVLILSVVFMWMSTSMAQYSIKEMTPEVSTALENRKNRFDQIRELKSKGTIGEDNKGYAVALDNSAQAIVDAENNDRKIIYQTIAEQNNLKDSIDVIEKVFGQVQRDKAQAGDKIQDEQGNWTVK